GLRDDLLTLYRAGDTQGCAIATGPNGPVMNPGCAMVHRHICAAAVEVIRTLVQAGRQDQARARREMFARDFACAVGTAPRLSSAKSRHGFILEGITGLSPVTNTSQARHSWSVSVDRHLDSVDARSS